MTGRGAGIDARRLADVHGDVAVVRCKGGVKPARLGADVFCRYAFDEENLAVLLTDQPASDFLLSA